MKLRPHDPPPERGAPAPDDRSQRPDYIPKDRVAAVVRTIGELIVGRLHVRPNKRLKDELNLQASDRYAAITDARVYDASGTRCLYATGIMLVATVHIVSVTPLDAIDDIEDAHWGLHPESGPAPD